MKWFLPEILFRNKDRDFFIEVFPFPQGNHNTHIVDSTVQSNLLHTHVQINLSRKFVQFAFSPRLHLIDSIYLSIIDQYGIVSSSSLSMFMVNYRRWMSIARSCASLSLLCVFLFRCWIIVAEEKEEESARCRLRSSRERKEKRKKKERNMTNRFDNQLANSTIEHRSSNERKREKEKKFCLLFSWSNTIYNDWTIHIKSFNYEKCSPHLVLLFLRTYSTHPFNINSQYISFQFSNNSSMFSSSSSIDVIL